MKVAIGLTTERAHHHLPKDAKVFKIQIALIKGFAVPRESSRQESSLVVVRCHLKTPGCPPEPRHEAQMGGGVPCLFDCVGGALPLIK